MTPHAGGKERLQVREVLPLAVRIPAEGCGARAEDPKEGVGVAGCGGKGQGHPSSTAWSPIAPKTGDCFTSLTVTVKVATPTPPFVVGGGVGVAGEVAVVGLQEERRHAMRHRRLVMSGALGCRRCLGRSVTLVRPIAPKLDGPLGGWSSRSGRACGQPRSAYTPRTTSGGPGDGEQVGPGAAGPILRGRWQPR